MPDDDKPKIHLSRHLTRLTMDAQTPSIIKALLEVFARWRVEQLDQEVLIHFALRALDVTPDSYFMVAGVVRQILANHERFSLSQGRLRETYETLEVRRVNVHLVAESPTIRPPIKVKVRPRGGR